MKEMLKEAFARYGTSVEVRRGEDAVRTKAFVQPIRKESGEEPFAVTALGAVDEMCWRYLGPADVEVAMGGRVICGEKQYVVRRAAPLRAGEEILYYWAVLREETTA